jgi:hypothetical protein
MFSQFFKKTSDDKTIGYRFPTSIYEKRIASRVFKTSVVLIAACMSYLSEEAQVTLGLCILLGGYMGYTRLIDTSQNAIRANLASFMRQACPEHEVELRKNLESKGQCFGLSVCHAAMHAIEKLDWWEAALVELANWDRSVSGLDRKVILPDADERVPVSLRIIFERMLNYITLHQAVYQSSSTIEDLQQYNLFDPVNKYFELIDTSGKIKTVHTSEVVACNFTPESLSILFDDHLENAICMFGNEKHAINMNYLGNDKWMIYNSNYSHESIETMHKIFSSKEEAAKEIISILGNTLIFNAAYLSAPKTNSLSMKFAEMIANSDKINIIRNGGLHALVTRAPKHLSQFFVAINGDNQAILLVAKYLVTKNSDEQTGFNFITEYAPDSLPALLQVIREVENARVLIAWVLATQDKKRWTGLHMVAKFAANQLPVLLDFIENEPSAREMLKDAWKLKNINGNSAASFVKSYAPECVNQVEELIRPNPFLMRSNY